jgi:hypothetical protein
MALLIACVIVPRERRIDLELDVRPTIVARARVLPPPLAAPLRITRNNESRPRTIAIEPVAPRRPRARPRTGAPHVDVPARDVLRDLLEHNALGDADETFRALGRAPDDGGRDVPAFGPLGGGGGGGRGEGTIGLGPVGRLDGGGTRYGDIYAPSVGYRLRPRTGPRIDCLTEMPCPCIDRGLADDAILVRRAVRRLQPRLRWCYERELRTHASLGGALVMRLVVDRSGRVGPVTVGETTLGEGGDAIAACFREELETLLLPARVEPLLLTWPFRLQPTVGEETR